MQTTDASINTSFDLVIVGGGMAGLALAAGLKDLPIKIALVEAASQPPVWQAEKFNIRVSALSASSQQLLTKVGAWQPMQAMRVNPYYTMEVWDSQATGSLGFTAQEVDQPNLGYLVENAVTHLGLLAAVKNQANLTWFTGVKPSQLSQPLTEQGVRKLTLTGGQELTASLVVGADGANSSIRGLAGFATREWDYNHHALVTTVKTSQPNLATCWQVFHPNSILAFLPLNLDGDTRYSSIVWSAEPSQVEELLSLSEADFNQRLTTAFEGKLGEVLASEQRFSLPLRQRHSKNYVQAGVALVADAAHSIHPLAGQGINIGFADVACLTQVLSEAANLGKPLGSLDLLTSYQKERQPENLKMMALMEGLKRGFASQNLPWLVARNLGMKFINSSGILKQQLIKQALGV